MTIASILLVVLFVGITIWRTGEIPESISAMVYSLPKGGAQWLWTIWMILVDIFTFAPAIQVLDQRGLGFLAFLPMVMIAFVAVWPLFDEEHKKWHYVLGIAAGLVSQIDVWHICPWWFIAWLLVIAVMVASMFIKGKMMWMLLAKITFIVEAVCYVTLIGSLLTCNKL